MYNPHKVWIFLKLTFPRMPTLPYNYPARSRDSWRLCTSEPLSYSRCVLGEPELYSRYRD